MNVRLKLPGVFEPWARTLIRQMEDDGWTGRISTRHHAIMRSPDGTETCSVKPKVEAPRDRQNVGKEYRRWLKTRPVVEEYGTDDLPDY
jgi:predicted RNA binding protein YcfA (HicA-like mRNA interferase family)